MVRLSSLLGLKIQQKTTLLFLFTFFFINPKPLQGSKICLEILGEEKSAMQKMKEKEREREKVIDIFLNFLFLLILLSLVISPLVLEALLIFKHHISRSEFQNCVLPLRYITENCISKSVSEGRNEYSNSHTQNII